MFRITVRSIKGAILHFTVQEYEVKDNFVVFTDRYTGEKKRFAVSNCEIEEAN